MTYLKIIIPITIRMADGERFELSVSFETYTHFPGVRLKPLGHPSNKMA